MILGDSLLVMTSLAEKEGLKGKVQMIYLDPPYGIKFGSNWQVSTRKRDVKDGKAEDATRQPEQIKAFRDTWELGIHSYLAYLRDRLVVARELLTESGSVFVQIGDENVHLVRCLLDEVYGSENFCAHITFKKTGASTEGLLASGYDHVLWFAKEKSAAPSSGPPTSCALSVMRAPRSTSRSRCLTAPLGRQRKRSCSASTNFRTAHVLSGQQPSHQAITTRVARNQCRSRDATLRPAPGTGPQAQKAFLVWVRQGD